MTHLHATERLGIWLAAAASTPLAQDVAEKAAICLLDAVGLAVLAKEETTARAARGLAVPIDGVAGTARIWADGVSVSPGEAALANGIAAHAHFQDDTDHDSWSHPGSLVPPAVIACCEARNAGLTRTLRAIAVGYAIMKWLGIGEEVSRKLIGRGLRTSATFGTIGAAAGCAVAMGLDAAAAGSAIGIAASTTAGTLEPVRCGSDEWRVQNGRAAQGGYIAAALAEGGVRGAAQALEGPKGFLTALAAMDTPPAAWQDDPDTAIMMKIMAKPFATLGDNMSAACAAFVAHGRGIDPERIRSITVTLWRPYTEYPGTAYKGPYKTVVQAQASSAFAVCAMLIHGRLTFDMGVRDRENPLLLDLVAKTEIRPHDGSHLDSTVTVTLDDGTVVRADASEAPETLIFQDAARAISVFEERLCDAGHAAGHGTALAEDLLNAARRGEDRPIRLFLDALSGLPVKEARRA